MCGCHRSFRLCGGLPRGSALLGDRPPFLQRRPAAVHTHAKGFRAGRQNLTFVAVPHEKKEHISSTTVSTKIIPANEMKWVVIPPILRTEKPFRQLYPKWLQGWYVITIKKNELKAFGKHGAQHFSDKNWIQLI